MEEEEEEGGTLPRPTQVSQPGQGAPALPPQALEGQRKVAGRCSRSGSPGACP